MQKNNVPLKVAIGYTATAIVLIMAMVLVYSNTKSIYDINQASREYIQKQDVADSTMTRLLKEEQNNLKQLSEALAGKSSKGYLHAKVDSLSKAVNPSKVVEIFLLPDLKMETRMVVLLSLLTLIKSKKQ